MNQYLLALKLKTLGHHDLAQVLASFSSSVVYHGTTAELGEQIEQEGFLVPPRETGLDQWSGGPFGGNPSNPDLVYTTTTKSKALDYAKQVCKNNKTKDAAIVSVEPDWQHAVPDEDIIADIIIDNQPDKDPLVHKVWEAYTKALEFDSVDEAYEYFNRDPTEYGGEMPSDSQRAEDFKLTVKHLMPKLTPIELRQLTKSTIAFSKPLKVIEVEYFTSK